MASRQNQGFIPLEKAYTFPLTNIRNTLLSCTILLACLTFKPLFFKQSFTVSTHLFRSLPTERLSTFPYIVPLSNPVILHSLHIAETSENIFINPFVHTFRHSAQHLYSCIRDLSILLIPSKSRRLSTFTTLILDLSFSHSIILLPYIRINTSHTHARP